MPADGAALSLRALNRHTPNYPGRQMAESVPFSGRGGYRQPPKARPKLTKLQKKGLKWARKHPEPPPNYDRITYYNNSGATINVSLAATPTSLDEVLYGFVGEPATQETYTQVARAVQVFITDHYAHNIYTPTTATTDLYTPATDTTVVRQIPVTGVTLYTGNQITGTFTINTTSNITVTLPMSWEAWNEQLCAHSAQGWVDSHSQRAREAAGAWVRWQGQGHQADLYYNPNDQVQKARIRRERLLQQEAERAQQRMEQAARDAEARRQWEAGAPERERLRLEQEVALVQAKGRSYELLFRHLTDEQKAMLDNEHRFLIISQSGRMYEIRRGIMHNVFRLDEQGRAVEELCCYIPEVPEGDNLLGQMLHLMANENEFRRSSNRWELRDMSPVDRRQPLHGREAPNVANRTILPREIVPAVERRAA